MITPLFAQMNLNMMGGHFLFIAKLIVGVVFAVIGFYALKPISGILWRLAFQKKIPKMWSFVCRIVGGGLIGILAYWLFSFGAGMGLGGPDGGLGPSADLGAGQKENTKDKAEVNQKDNQTGTSKKDSTLTIEMIGIQDRKFIAGNKNWYHIEGKSPAVSLEEVEKLLKENQDKWKKMTIVVYKNSPHPRLYHVQRLREKAEEYNLTPSVELPNRNKEDSAG